jgi:hypothetical protein
MPGLTDSERVGIAWNSLQSSWANLLLVLDDCDERGEPVGRDEILYAMLEASSFAMGLAAQRIAELTGGDTLAVGYADMAERVKNAHVVARNN